LRGRDNAPAAGRFQASRDRSVAIKGEMSSRLVMVVEIGAKDAHEMALAEHDDAVQTFSADGSDQAFHIRILPGRLRRDYDLFDAHVSDALPDASMTCWAVNSAVEC
jgi:hypothetical protein